MLVDDNPWDLELVKTAFEVSAMNATFLTARDGVQALDQLQRIAVDPGGNLPVLILLDLNMPRMNGWDLLECLRENAALRGIPTVVLTSSTISVERERCRRLGALDCWSKPSSFEDLLVLTQRLWPMILASPSAQTAIDSAVVPAARCVGDRP